MQIVAPIPRKGGPRIAKNPSFLKTGKIIQNAKTQKRLDLCQNQRYTLRTEVSHPSGSVVFYGKISKKNKKKCAAILDHFQTKMFKSETTSFHYFSPRIPNLSLEIRLWEVGAKRRFNCTSKVNRQTHTRTNTWTFRLIESIDPEGRCFENYPARKLELLRPEIQITKVAFDSKAFVFVKGLY